MELCLQRATIESPIVVELFTSTACMTNDSVIADFVCEHFICCSERNALVRTRMLENDSVFQRCSDTCVQRLVDKLVLLDDDEVETIASLRTALLGILRHLTLGGNAAKATSIIIDRLQCPSDSERRTPGLEPVLLKLTEQWRELLLGDSCYEDSHYADAVVTLVREMINSPSSMEPLTVLGWITAWKRDNELFSWKPKRRVSLLIERLSELCVAEFNRLKIEKCMVGNDIFRRLCPLLALRRIPIQFYRIAQGFFADEGTHLPKFAKLSCALGKHLVDRVAMTSSQDERRLAAECCSRLMPFCNVWDADDLCLQNKFSLFDLLCDPLFVQQANAISAVVDFSRGEVLNRWRSARASLYAICASIAETTDVVGIDELSSIVCACFKFLEVDVDPSETKNQSLLDEVDKMRAGCCDVFSLFFLRFFVQERDKDESDPFSYASSELLKLLETFQTRGPAARICIWNCLILAAKRSNEGNLANATHFLVPWVVRWVNKTSVEGRRWRGLDTAGAMQLTFTLITRRKSAIVCAQPEDMDQLFPSLLNWTVDTLRGQQENGPFDRNARTEALKLLLALIALGSRDSELLSPGRLGDTLRALHEIHAVETDDEFRSQLSAIISVLLNPENLSGFPEQLARSGTAVSGS